LALIVLLSQNFIIRYYRSRLNEVLSILLPDNLQKNVPLNVVDLALLRRQQCERLTLIAHILDVASGVWPVTKQVAIAEGFTFGQH
jgi:hypothetical protein